MIHAEDFPHDALHLDLLIASKKAAQEARFFVFYLCASNALKGLSKLRFRSRLFEKGWEKCFIFSGH